MFTAWWRETFTAAAARVIVYGYLMLFVGVTFLQIHQEQHWCIVRPNKTPGGCDVRLLTRSGKDIVEPFPTCPIRLETTSFIRRCWASEHGWRVHWATLKFDKPHIAVDQVWANGQMIIWAGAGFLVVCALLSAVKRANTRANQSWLLDMS